MKRELPTSVTHLIRSILFICMLTSAQVAFAQTQISGVINDDQGQPLPGANVLLKGTSNGVTTDAAGRFTGIRMY